LERHRLGPESDVFGRHDHYIKQFPAQAMSAATGDRVQQILAMVDESDVDEVTVEEGDLRITVRKSAVGGGQELSPAAEPVTAPSRAAAAPGDEADGHHVVRSPMVGTFYAAPDPESPPFVKVGDHVGPDTIVCIVEAMKVFNQIPAEVSGRITAVLVENGSSVEFGQPLFKIEAGG